MKLTLYNRGEPLRALDLMCSVDPSNEPNRPQISSVTSNVKEQRKQSQPLRPILLKRASLPILSMLLPLRSSTSQPPRSVSRRAPQRRR
ncbi:hypothetical protein FPS10_10270 [Pseudoruegeria sp. M32A2M]|nr:hypothetical protein [Pseudoruegeria sp. M32A2M]